MIEVATLGISLLIATICFICTIASCNMPPRPRRSARQRNATMEFESKTKDEASKKSDALLADTLDPSTANLQSQAPLFMKIPPEIRNRIFSLVLRTFDDKARPYEPGTFWARPETSHPLKLDNTLLLTCRRVYLETYILPCFQYQTNYWWGRGPPHERDCQNPVHYLDKLTPAQRARSAVNVFVQQYMLEGAFKSQVMAHPDVALHV